MGRQATAERRISCSPPVLSILMPSYNCDDVIDEAVESALSETRDLDAEVVIVDDGSTDSTAQRARAWEARFPERVRLGFHEHNRGGAAARNTAAGIGAGDLLYILDADNVLSEGCIASQLAHMRTTGLDAVSVGGVYYFEGSTANVVEGWVLPHTDGRSTLRHLFETVKVPASHGNYMFSRRLFDAAGGYWEDAGAMESWTFGLKHLARGFEVGIDRRSHYLHRLNRPDRESYWSREQRVGTNDVNAVRALRREADNLPEQLRELVVSLEPRDRLFALISSGAFRSDPGWFRHVRRRERAKHVAMNGVQQLRGITSHVRDGRPAPAARVAL
jgi:glycosyltransferase involved in cell wall biosynthesis